MTKVEFFDQDGKLTGFSVSGHSGYAEEGADIVCASVSTAVTFADAVITDVLGVSAKVKKSEKDARITLALPASYEEEDAVQAVLSGMMLTLCALRDQYPDYIEVIMEV